MNLKRRSLLIFSIFMATAFLVIAFGLAFIDRSEIKKQIGNLVPEFRRSLIGGDNRAVRNLIRASIKDPLIAIEVRRFDGIIVDSQRNDENSALLIFNFESPLSLTVNENAVGFLKAQYTLDQSLKNGFYIWIIFLFISLPIFVQFRINLVRIEELNIENARESTIARTTQMLAHDVRKPFALFRMTIDRVKTAGTPEQVQQALQEALPEVERSLANVNGLISDVLNVGCEFNLVLKPVRLAPIVDDVIEELRKLHPSRSLNVQVSIAPQVWVEADDTRLPRVFLNILSNAIEAVETHDVQLWVSAQASPTGSIDVRVGNLGSFIPAEARNKLFDLFYTSGKKGGTGLGLAIVKKILQGHGSAVQCVSERTDDAPLGKVEFIWTLRAARATSEFSKSPGSDSMTQLSAPIAPVSSVVARETSLDARPNVVFLDDSPLARWVWEAKLKNEVRLQSYVGPSAFLSALDTNSLSLNDIHTVITDHYFAPDEKLTGTELAAALRERGFTGRIYLASNGEFDVDKLKGVVDKIVDKQPTDWDVLNS